MVIIKNATTSSGKPLEAEKRDGPPTNWVNNTPLPPQVPPQPPQIPQQPPQIPQQPPQIPQQPPQIPQQPPQTPPQEQEKKEGATETTVEEWLDQLIIKAIASRASDIHFEPERENFTIRVRIDGMLHLLETLDFQYQEVVISRIKILGQMDITKHRLPQDGGFEFTNQTRVYNIRISTYPTIYGEVAVLRILDRESLLLDLKDLGFDETQLKMINRLILKPYGMILITGPSGSGKTTLLYSILNILNKPENNIMTIEDPVEVQMNKIRQAQTNQYQDFNFPTALRAVLRQDPDIVMVGEIRDKETAQISFQAALTGKLIFSTFHTLDVFAVVTRLIEMDIPRSVVAHTIEGMVSSRLVRQICQACKVEYKLSENEKHRLSKPVPDDIKIYKGKGCNKCSGTGYYGRIGVFEVVLFDDEIRNAILTAKSSAEMLELFKQKKIKSLSDAAMEKVIQGITTIEEVLRVTG